MIVVELDPTQQSFEPWDAVADENGEIYTSWYIFSSDFIGATLQATATGESSQLTASATFTDATQSGDGTMTVSPTSVQPNSTGNTFTFSFRNGANDILSTRARMPLSWFQPVGQRRKLRIQVHPALSLLRQLAQDRVRPDHSQWYWTLDHHSAFHRKHRGR